MAKIANQSYESDLLGQIPNLAYARLLGLDTAPMNLQTKAFVLEISKNADAREETGQFASKRKYKDVNLSSAWQLPLELTTTIAEVVIEAYRCLDVVYPEFATKWNNDI
jgi:hypothetical protein